MIYIILISLILFRIMVYPSYRRHRMIKEFEKQAEVINKMFAELDKTLDEIEKKEK